MRILALDTSGPFCSVALWDDGAVVAKRHENVGRGHAERLIPWIADLPDGGRADQIRVGCGPGSFTGVRIAIAAARGLGIGWGVPVLGLSSLALIASGAASIAETVTVAIEAGHGELFVQRFGSAPVRELASLTSRTPEDAAGSIDAHVVGSGAQRLVAARGWGTWHDLSPNALWLFDFSDDMFLADAVPIYGRAPDAKPMP